MIRRDSNIPVIMITAMGEVVDQIKAFKLKVDDYITKPFDMKLVLVRVDTMFRRSEASGIASQEKDKSKLVHTLGKLFCQNFIKLKHRFCCGLLK